MILQVNDTDGRPYAARKAWRTLSAIHPKCMVFATVVKAMLGVVGPPAATVKR